LNAKDQFKLYKQFHKIKNPNWTEEVFKVSQVFCDGYIIKYKVVDMDGNEYQRKYYHHQLLLIHIVGICEMNKKRSNPYHDLLLLLLLP